MSAYISIVNGQPIVVPQATLDLAKFTILQAVQPTPTPTGNVGLENTMFKDGNGDTYAVDKDGNSIKAGSSPAPLTYATLAEALAGVDTIKVINSETLKGAIDASNQSADGVSIVGTGVTSNPFTIKYATEAEVIAGTNATKAVNSATLKAKTDSTLSKDIVSGEVTGNELVFTLADGTTLPPVDVTTLANIADLRLSSGVFNDTTGNIDFTMSNGSIISVPVANLLPVTTDSTLRGNGTTSDPLSIPLAPRTDNSITHETGGMYSKKAIVTNYAGTVTGTDNLVATIVYDNNVTGYQENFIWTLNFNLTSNTNQKTLDLGFGPLRLNKHVSLNSLDILGNDVIYNGVYQVVYQSGQFKIFDTTADYVNFGVAENFPNARTPAQNFTFEPNDGQTIELRFDGDSQGGDTLDTGFGAVPLLYTDQTVIDEPIKANMIRKQSRYILVYNAIARGWNVINYAVEPLVPSVTSPFANVTTLTPSTSQTADAVRTGKIAIGGTDAPTATIDDYGTFTTRGGAVIANTTATYTIATTALEANSMLKIKQSIVDTTLTIAPPASPIAGRFLRVHNDETSTKNLIYNGRVVEPGRYIDLQWNENIWASESMPYAGNTILDKPRLSVNANTDYVFDNYTITFHGSTPNAGGALFGLSIKHNAPVTAGVTMHHNGFISYSGDGIGAGGWINDSNPNATPIAVGATASNWGELNMEQIVEMRRYHLYFSTGQHYVFEIIRDDQVVSATIDKIGITTNQVLTGVNGISIVGGVVSNSNRVAKISVPIATAQTGTEVLAFGEFDFRYSLNGTNGLLQLRSATAKAGNDVWFVSEAEYLTIETQSGAASLPLAVNTWTSVGTLVTGLRQIITHRFTTVNNTYFVKIVNHNDTHIHFIVEKEA